MSHDSPQLSLLPLDATPESRCAPSRGYISEAHQNRPERSEARIDSFTGTYRFLSNFSPAPVAFDGVTYATVEHAYQAAKTLNEDERREIAALPKPGQAKRAGRRVTMRADWDDVKISVMEEMLRLKFAQPRLAEALLSTGDAELIEGNNWNDRFWGVCLGRGRNELGKSLMRVRASLRTGAVAPAPLRYNDKLSRRWRERSNYGIRD